MNNLNQTKTDAIKQAQYILANPQKYLLIDVETTGVMEHDEVIQLAIINLKGETLFNSYFIPSVPISEPAFASNKLDIDTLVARRATSYKDRASEIATILEDKIILYYASNHFDKKLLNQTAVKYGVREVIYETIDIMGMRRIAEGSTRASKNGGNHDARTDALMSLEHLKNIASIPIPELVDIETLAAKRHSLNEKKLAIVNELKDVDADIKKHMTDSGKEVLATANGFSVIRKLSVKGTKLRDNVTLEDIDNMYIQPATLKTRAVKDAIDKGIDVSWFATYTEDFNVDVKTTR